MEPDEARAIFQELRDLLVETGFTWVVENVEAELNRGVQVAQELPRFQEPPPAGQTAPRRRERRETATSARPHTEVERLGRMLDEIERCVILPIRIANDLPKRLSPNDTPLSAVEVVDTQAETVVFRVDSRTEIASDHTASLEIAIAQIRGRLNAT